MTRTRTAAGTIRAVLVLTAAMLACGGRTADLGGPGGGSSGGSGGSGSSSGSFPYSGPSCDVPQGCWSCLEGACPNVGCISTDCSAYFNCFCACAKNDAQCYQGCAQSAMTQACTSCAMSISTCQNSCQSQCTTTMMGGGSGSSGGGGFGSSSGGPTGEQVCSGSSANTCTNGSEIQFCQALTNGACTTAFYTVGQQTFPCASCTDTAGCAQAAQMACQ